MVHAKKGKKYNLNSYKKMKKFCFVALSLIAFATAANAQKTTTTYHYEDTQARALNMETTGYVKPIVNEVKVDATRGRMKFSIDMTDDFVMNDMKKDPVNVRSYGVFKATEAWNCDVVVAPTFHMFTNDKGGFTLELIGFAGTFINWRTMTDADLEWIRVTQTRQDGNQIEAVTKPTRTR